VLQYRAGASLFEQVKLLNRSLKDIPHFRGFTPYIVTIQVALIPYRRDAPYDAYADIAFFTDTNTPPTLPDSKREIIPLVYPLPASDALEMSNDQQSRNQLRQLGFALAAAFHGAGIQAGVDQLNQNLGSVSGFNLNSLITVGKLSPNCIEVRIGARSQTESTNELNMVPETHNVSFLVFAPTDAGELQMLSRTIFRHVVSNEILQEKPDLMAADDFLTNVADYFFDSHYEVIDSLKKHTGSKEAFDDLANKALDIMFDTNSIITDSNNIANLPISQFQQAFADFFSNANVWPVLKKALKKAGVSDGRIDDLIINPFKDKDVNDINALWLDLTRVAELGDQYANDLIPLPIWRPVLPPTNQTVLYTDSGETTVFMFDNDGETLPTDKITAILTITNLGTNASVTLYSHKIESD